MRWIVLASAVVALAAVLAGCGGSGHPAATAPATTLPPTTAAQPPATTTASGPGALQAEANAAAAGDIPDNQVFLVFHNPRAGYSMKYPEGWAQQGSGKAVVFRDKNNLVRVVVDHGAEPTTASIRRDLSREKGVHVQAPPQSVSLPGSRALKVVYSTVSAPNAVTGK